MSDIHIRVEGHAGRITLNRPKALNALTYDMISAIETAIDAWRDDDAVKLVIIDAIGDKAFCAGGDIQQLYKTGLAGDFAYGQKFWADEYRLNAKIADYPKPYVALMQGFTMGGGVGVSCHGSHRIVCENSQIAMPECGIGLVPDVGGSLLLARAPGYLGEYLGTTGVRMKTGDAIYAGFADHFLPQKNWPDVLKELVSTGDTGVISHLTQTPPDSTLGRDKHWLDHHFSQGSHAEIIKELRAERSEENAYTLITSERSSPLSMACTIEMLKALRANPANIQEALSLEYRFTWRSMQSGDFLEGIRALIIDKDRKPQWQHQMGFVEQSEINKMLAPLGENELNWKAEL